MPRHALSGQSVAPARVGDVCLTPLHAPDGPRRTLAQRSSAHLLHADVLLAELKREVR